MCRLGFFLQYSTFQNMVFVIREIFFTKAILLFCWAKSIFSWALKIFLENVSNNLEQQFSDTFADRSNPRSSIVDDSKLRESNNRFFDQSKESSNTFFDQSTNKFFDQSEESNPKFLSEPINPEDEFNDRIDDQIDFEEEDDEYEAEERVNSFFFLFYHILSNKISKFSRICTVHLVQFVFRQI